MQPLLTRLEALLAQHHPEYLVTLNPGASKTALDEFQATLAHPLTPEFVLLYSWHDGSSSPFCLYHEWMFSPLEQITNTKSLLDCMIGHEFARRPGWWLREWVPFLSNGNGDLVCLDLESGQVLVFYHDWERRPVEASSLEEWLRDVIRLYETDSWYEREEE